LNFENKSIENITNKKLDHYFHCNKERINSSTDMITLVLTTERPHEDIVYELIKINGFDCFLYNDNLSAPFWNPNIYSWKFLMRKQKGVYLFDSVTTYVLINQNTETEIKL